MKAIKQSILYFVLCLFLLSCSIRRIAINSVANSLSAGGSNVFATDNVPELVRDAIPFGLKLNEALLNEIPNHKGLLLATASGFTQYAYAFVQIEADFLEEKDFAAANRLRKQAQKLYLRSREYAVRGLEADHPGFMDHLHSNPQSVLRSMTSDDLPFLYWMGVSWAAAISASKENLDLLSELYLVEAIMNRALELDEDYNNGALHEFFITFDGSRSIAMGGSIERAREHFDRAIKLSEGKKASPYLSLAENVSVRQQNVKEFVKLLKMALAIDVDAKPEYRLENILLQRRASWLLSRIDDFFLVTEEFTKME
ncbi:MAG: TRAP transporter TatT component family protein [Planctomycetota bacterium]|jgi:predicted anti-sigma-YlaC factor YlaD